MTGEKTALQCPAMHKRNMLALDLISTSLGFGYLILSRALLLSVRSLAIAAGINNHHAPGQSNAVGKWA